MAISGLKEMLLLFTVLIFAWITRFSIKHYDDSIYLFSFLLCFFTFLLGGQLITNIIGAYNYTFDENIELHTNICLFISLTGLILGYFFSRNVYFVTKNRQTKTIDYNSAQIILIRRISKWSFYILYFLWMLILADRVIFVLQHGYTSYYVDYTTRLNVIIRYFGYMAPSAFFLFLATMPAKKEARVSIILYDLYMVASLGTGRRIYIMTGLLIVFAYYCCRNHINPGDKPWISKRQMMWIAIIVPLLLAGMYLFEYIRSEYYSGTASAYNPIVGFFVRQGTSINVIKFAESYKSELDPTATYSFYNLTRRLQYSPLNSLFKFDFVFGRQSVETALHGNRLADFISYKVNKYSYLRGTGWGSCYIAELYTDFGYIGVFIGNFLYGVLLNRILKSTLRGNNVWLTACGFLLVDSLFKAPRAEFDAFLGQFIYFNNWGFILLVFLIVNMRKSATPILIGGSSKRG